MLVESGREPATDKKFEANEANSRYSNFLFLRLVARKLSFKNVDFRYTIFDTCYMRNCYFDSCDFTGCRFVGTNLNGSKFSGCKFDYAVFERTSIDAEVLDTECPGLENLKARFARTLRTNYQQLGDAQAANKAMKVELQATEIHLHKAWRSNEGYYRKNYQGLQRFKAFIEWLDFKTLDFIWGNGESAIRLFRSVLIILCGMALWDIIEYGDFQKLDSYPRAIIQSAEIFIGVLSPDSYDKTYLASVTLIRLVAIGFFLSILIKRFNRR
jgi:hypothetical protein